MFYMDNIKKLYHNIEINNIKTSTISCSTKTHTCTSLFRQLLTSLIFNNLFNIFNFTSLGYTYQWLQFTIFLIYDLGMFEMVGQLKCSLIASVTYIAYFWGLVPFPFLLMKFLVEIFQESRVHEIDKSVPNITVILHK